MKLNNKGFAISSIMYIILILAVVLIALTLSTLSSRKFILDKLRNEVLTAILDEHNMKYKKILNLLKSDAINYMTDNSLEKVSLKIENMDSNVNSETLEKYKLTDKYITAVKNAQSYNVYLGKTTTISNETELPKNTLDILSYKVYGNSVQNGTPTLEEPIEVESVGEKTKNLLTPPVAEIAKGLTWTINYDKSVTINGTSTATTNINYMRDDTVQNLGFKAGVNYTMSHKISGTTEFRHIRIYNVTTGKTIYSSEAGRTFKFDNLTDTIRIGLNIQPGITFTDFNIKYQIEEGTIATDYEPYGYKIPVKVSNGTEEIITNIYLDEPLRKINNTLDGYADYIDFENKKVVRNVKKMELTREITVVNNPYFTNANGYRILTRYADDYSSSSGYGFSNYFIRQKSSSTLTSGIVFGTSINMVVPFDANLSTLEDFQEWLGQKYTEGTPVKIYYALETPTEETIELPNIPILKGINILEVDTTIQPSNYEFTIIEKMIEI